MVKNAISWGSPEYSKVTQDHVEKQMALEQSIKNFQDSLNGSNPSASLDSFDGPNGQKVHDQTNRAIVCNPILTENRMVNIIDQTTYDGKVENN